MKLVGAGVVVVIDIFSVSLTIVVWWEATRTIAKKLASTAVLNMAEQTIVGVDRLASGDGLKHAPPKSPPSERSTARNTIGQNDSPIAPTSDECIFE